MSKDKIQLLSPLFLKYQADYEKNPRSRVFAPLAETYRKLGMTDKAMEILAQGIRFHPTYVMGYLGLAFCYADLKQYTLAYNTLRPIVETSRDNIRLQKLFADVCLHLSYKEEALDAYKYLLFINPRDKEVSLQVAALENMIEDQYKPVHQPIFIPESEFRNESKVETLQRLFDVDKLESKPNSSKIDFDDWQTLDLGSEQPKIDEADSYDSWNLNKGTSVDFSKGETPAVAPIIEEELTFVAAAIPIDPTKYHDEEIHLSLDDEDEDDQDDIQEEKGQAVPMVTHTLVDLYCGQGHIEKALEVLEKILILNPRDQKTIQKISEIKALMEPIEALNTVESQNIAAITAPMEKTKPVAILQEASEEEGRKNLMSILDQQLGNVDLTKLSELAKVVEQVKRPPKKNTELEKKRLIEEKLGLFLKKIQKRALDYQARV
jgi:tetratricopeptide (TPR) repeat protein